MDVCAFVGVAPRGPARVPMPDDEVDEQFRRRPFLDPQRRRRSVAVAVESFDEYKALYGGFEGHGRLPYAVQAFFEQGGRRAYVVRIVHAYHGEGDTQAVARGLFRGLTTDAGDDVALEARSEGSWGNHLQAAMEFYARPVPFDRASTTELVFKAETDLPAGSLLRLAVPGGERTLNFAARSQLVPRGGTARGNELRVVLDTPMAEVPLAVEVLEARVTIDDAAGRREVHDYVGIDPVHPRWFAQVLCDDSELVYPERAWFSARLVPRDVALTSTAIPAGAFEGGEDRESDITPADFFDERWVLGNDLAGSGVHALVKIADVAMVSVPDLYDPLPLPAAEDIRDPATLAGAEFGYCHDMAPPSEQATAPRELVGLRLDPRTQFGAIIGWQSKLVDLAHDTRAFIALLDVPPGLRLNQILRWRQQFSTAFAAAYHPWIYVSPGDDNRDALIRIPPSAIAAGIIADRERRFGIQHGPANVVAIGAVNLETQVAPEVHAQLHAAGINVFVRDPEGFRLTTARTLSADRDYRQLSVRRLVTMLARTLEQQMQWVVFEPHTVALRTGITRAIAALLRELFLANAFAGATGEEAFFVRCDERLNDQRTVDAGQLIVEIGVAPAEPLEFIIVRLVRSVDGRLTVEA